MGQFVGGLLIQKSDQKQARSVPKLEKLNKEKFVSETQSKS